MTDQPQSPGGGNGAGGEPGAAGPADPDHPDPQRERGDGLAFPHDPAPEPGDSRDLGGGLHWIRMPLPWSLDHINLYALAGEDGWTLVDTGIASKTTQAHWQALLDGPLGDLPVARILVTHHHPDHIGCAAWLAEAYGAPIYATRVCWLLARTLSLDVAEEPPEEVIAFLRRAGLPEDMIEAQRRAGWGNFAKLVAPLPVGYRRIAGGDTLQLAGTDWQVIETGGHAPGHASLVDPHRRMLLAGDQILPLISSNVSVYPTEPYANPMAEWLEGLARMRALPADTLVLPAHNRPFIGVDARLEALIAKHVDRMADLAELCRAPKAATEVFPALFLQRILRDGYTMAAGEALAHLHFLEAEGVLGREPGADGVDRFVQVAAYDAARIRARLEAVTQAEKEDPAWAA